MNREWPRSEIDPRLTPRAFALYITRWTMTFASGWTYEEYRKNLNQLAEIYEKKKE